MHVQAQAPAFVCTKMAPEDMRPSLDAPPADKYVASAVRHIGYEDLSVPYFKHAMDRCGFRTLFLIFQSVLAGNLLRVCAQRLDHVTT